MLELIQKFFGSTVEPKSVVEKKPLAYYKHSFKEWKCKGCKESFLYRSIRCPICECVEIDEVEIPTSYGLRKFD